MSARERECRCVCMCIRTCRWVYVSLRTSGCRHKRRTANQLPHNGEITAAVLDTDTIWLRHLPSTLIYCSSATGGALAASGDGNGDDGG